MNYIRHLAGFFDRVAKDDRLGPLHVSMYVSLFQFWNASRFKNPISISRSELMRVSKISAKATYHKCIKELNNFGYLRYEPSFNPIRGSLVYLFNFETGDEPLEERSHTKNETGSEQLEEPYINNTNIINNKTAYEQSDENSSSDFSRVGQETEKNRYSDTKKRRTGPEGQAVSLPTSIIEVQAFFEQEKSTKLEAEKFFNYFQSNGWKVGGRAPMKDWNAAARNWILNSKKFETKKNTSLHATTGKDYGEPL
jgi:hypothetical protein